MVHQKIKLFEFQSWFSQISNDSLSCHDYECSARFFVFSFGHWMFVTDFEVGGVGIWNIHGVLLKREGNISCTMTTCMWFDSPNIFFHFLCCVFNFWKCKVKRLNVLFCSFFAIGCLIWGLVIIFLFYGFVFLLLWNFGLEIGNIHHH